MSLRVICDLILPSNQNPGYAYVPPKCFFLTLINLIENQPFLIYSISIALAQLRSKLLKCLRHKRQRCRLKVIAAQALSQVKQCATLLRRKCSPLETISCWLAQSMRTFWNCLLLDKTLDL